MCHSKNTNRAWTKLTSRARYSTHSLEPDMPRHARRISRRGQHADCRRQNQSKVPLREPPPRRGSGWKPHQFPEKKKAKKSGTLEHIARKITKKTNRTTFGNLTNIYSLCLGLAYPSDISELPSTLFCLCSKKYACGRDGLMTY